MTLHMNVGSSSCWLTQNVTFLFCFNLQCMQKSQLYTCHKNVYDTGCVDSLVSGCLLTWQSTFTCCTHVTVTSVHHKQLQNFLIAPPKYPYCLGWHKPIHFIPRGLIRGWMICVYVCVFHQFVSFAPWVWVCWKGSHSQLLVFQKPLFSNFLFFCLVKS